MEVEAEAVAGAMEKSRPAAVLTFCGITPLDEKFLDAFMGPLTFLARSDSTDGEALSGTNRLPHGALSCTGSATHHRAGQITEVSAAGLPRKDIDNDELIGPEWAVATLVRVTGLASPSDNGALGNPPGTQDGGIGLGSENFAGEAAATPDQPVARAGARSPEDFDGPPQAGLGDPKGAANRGDFLFGFALALRPEVPRHWLDP